MKRFAPALLLVGACNSSPAGTVLVDWTYTDPPSQPHAKTPPKIVSSDEDWPVAGAPPLKLHFETEIGDLEDSVDHVPWNWPRHVRITLAAKTSVKLPNVICMPAPPGNKIVDGKLVQPLGQDGVRKGVVACFVSGASDNNYVYDIDGEGKITRSVPSKS